MHLWYFLFVRFIENTPSCDPVLFVGLNVSLSCRGYLRFLNLILKEKPRLSFSQIKITRPKS